MDFHNNTSVAMGDVFAPARRQLHPLSHHTSSPPRPNFASSSQQVTLHYRPQAGRKQFEPSWQQFHADRLANSCRREMDAVDEEMIMRLCYALELDKLYVLPDLGLSADIVNRM